MLMILKDIISNSSNSPNLSTQTSQPNPAPQRNVPTHKCIMMECPVCSVCLKCYLQLLHSGDILAQLVLPGDLLWPAEYIYVHVGISEDSHVRFDLPLLTSSLLRHPLFFRTASLPTPPSHSLPVNTKSHMVHCSCHLYHSLHFQSTVSYSHHAHSLGLTLDFFSFTCGEFSTCYFY